MVKMDEWSSAFEAKSDQINAIDLVVGAQTFTIESLSHGTPEQPMNIHLVESPGRAYRPSRTMRRFMAKVWGKPEFWPGKRLTLFRNPKTRFGKDEVGGIEISHVSGISSSMTFVLPGARGGRPKTYTAEPLAEAPQTAPNIPQEVMDTTAGISDPEQIPKYAEYLKSQGAPAHVTDWVLAQRKES